MPRLVTSRLSESSDLADGARRNPPRMPARNRLPTWKGAGVSILLMLLVLAQPLGARGQQDEFELPPILYSSSQPHNRVAQLQQQIEQGEKNLDYDEQFGYLRSLLAALEVPESSQMLVFSKTSLQRNRISPKTPRALYFSDDVYIGFCQSGEVLEISAVDPQLGTVFYTLDQEQAERPLIERQGDSCLICHGSSQTQNIPGHLVRSLFTDTRGIPILSSGSHRIDHTSPFEQRWGGWYVTGTHGQQRHRGNLVVQDKRAPEEIDNAAGQNVVDLGDRIETSNYLTPHSDIVALMVLEHQTQGHNLLAKANFETRTALHREAALKEALGETDDRRWDSTVSRIRAAGEPLVRYLLMSGEAPLMAPVRGTSEFAQHFVDRGPNDPQGRSLRQFDLQRRLFKYPCSYLIYSEAFDTLPPAMLEYVYRRLWEVLSGEDRSPEMAHLSPVDRANVLAILRATKTNLPDSWH